MAKVQLRFILFRRILFLMIDSPVENDSISPISWNLIMTAIKLLIYDLATNSTMCNACLFGSLECQNLS